MERFFIRIIVLALCLCSALCFAKTQIKDVRIWPSPASTRLVFDLTNPAEYELFSLSNPDRLVIDVKSAQLIKKLDHVPLDKSPIAAIRYAEHDKNKLRIVLDLNAPVWSESFTLTPNNTYGHRLVVDLHRSTIKPKKVENKLADYLQTHPFIVAIDAGHGGEDPGSIGRKGTREKDVVLAIAKELAELIKKEPGMEPLLIRSGDYYVGLRQRVNKARKAQADLFLSIHADSFHNPKAHGGSVFVLSEHGASSAAAKWLADKENQVDLIGGVSLDDKDAVLASVLLDLSQAASNEFSMKVGSAVLNQMAKIGTLHGKGVQQAGFAVLKAPDIPSILVETAFISNPEGEANLRSKAFQKKMALAIMEGIRQYVKTAPRVRDPLPPLYVADK